MRNTLIILGVTTTLAAEAQFAPVGAQWTYDQEDSVYTMTSVGDTLIAGHSCSIIAGSSYSVCWQSQAYTYQSGDTVFWSDDMYLPQFFELYRWNATAGESWDVWANGTVTVTYTVLSTGTTTVNGQGLRTLNIAATSIPGDWAQSSGVLIENIGDTLFMFPWLASFCDAIVPWPLRCYTDDNLGTFMRPNVTDCAVSTAIPGNTEEPALLFHPSLIEVGMPTVFNAPSARIDRLEVFDPSGRRVKVIDTSSRKAELTFSHPGCYVLRWEANGHSHHQRIIVR